jgi:hypothetical protein
MFYYWCSHHYCSGKATQRNVQENWRPGRRRTRFLHPAIIGVRLVVLYKKIEDPISIMMIIILQYFEVVLYYHKEMVKSGTRGITPKTLSSSSCDLLLSFVESFVRRLRIQNWNPVT